MLLTEIRDKPSELMTLALVRAAMCERLTQTLAPTLHSHASGSKSR